MFLLNAIAFLRENHLIFVTDLPGSLVRPSSFSQTNTGKGENKKTLFLKTNVFKRSKRKLGIEGKMPLFQFHQFKLSDSQ
jgi:hypothetical protein